MAPKLPRITAEKLARSLSRAGFQVVRQSGSHRIYEHADGRDVAPSRTTPGTCFPRRPCGESWMMLAFASATFDVLSDS